MAQNNLDSQNKFTRFPAVRSFIEDLHNGNWVFDENILESRYGKIKRVRLCGTVIQKREVVDEGNEESFLMDNSELNSRITFNIDDGTGQIQTTIWNVDIEKFKLITSGSMVDIVGIVRIYNNKVQVTLDYIRELKDPNFETYHRFEVLKKRKTEPKYEFTKQDSYSSDNFDFAQPDDNFDYSDDQDLFSAPTNKTSAIIEDNFDESEDFDEEDSAINEIKSSSEDSIPSTINASNQDEDPFAALDLNEKIIQFIKNNDDGNGVSRIKILEKFALDPKKMDDILYKLELELIIYKPTHNQYSCY